MYHYKIYDSHLCSDIQFNQLLKCEEEFGKADIYLYLKKIEEASEVFKNKGFYAASVKKNEIYFRNQCGVFLVKDGNFIQVWPHDNIEIKALTPFILGYCMAMVFLQRGIMAVHCSAVELNGKGILIAGGSGSGKSTLTNRLLEGKFKLLADDVVMLNISDDGRIYCLPAFPQQKLCRDAAEKYYGNLENLTYIDEQKDKFAISRTDRFGDKKVPLDLFIHLEKSQNVQCVSYSEIKGHEKINEIINNLFLIPMFKEEGGFSPENMSSCIKIAAACRIIDLRRPLSGDTTKEQEEIICQLSGEL